MQTRHFILLATLVYSIHATAAEVLVIDLSTDAQSEFHKNVTPNKEVEGLDISPAPEPSPSLSKLRSKQDIFFNYTTSFSGRMGLGSTSADQSDLTYFHLFGFQYMFESKNDKHWEAGTDVYNDGTGALHVGYKKIFMHNNLFRPYLKLGAGVNVMPDEKLVTFFNFKNYEVRPSLGFEYSLMSQFSCRVDFETMVNQKRLGYFISMGYSLAL